MKTNKKPNAKKIELVADLQKKLQEAKSVILADYQGLKVSQIQNFKNDIRKVDGEFTVVKNTLLNIALRNLKYQIPEGFEFSFPTAILISFQDEIAPLKKLIEFAKTSALPKIKMGFLGKDFLTLEKVKELSKIPGKQELYAKAVSTLNGPIYATVWAMKGNITKLVTVLNNYNTKRQAV